MPTVTTATGEVLEIKSPAEFFADNQQIAGFDNHGKALYTTIRELVENALDAAESAGVLPDISVSLTEMTTAEFDSTRGVAQRARKDADLFAAAGSGSKKGAAASKGKKATPAGGGGGGAAAAAAAAAAKGGKKSAMMYYKLVCKDNGCGMPHDAMPDMLGRVLAGSKYGVRQTRGKFGLGAKMALIWAKKSTGKSMGK